MKMLYQKTEKFLRVFVVIGAVFLVSAMFLTVCDVISRYAFNHPLPGVTELCAMTMIIYSFFGIAYDLLIHKHVRMPAIYDRFSDGTKRIVDIFLYTLITFFCVILTYASVILFWQSLKIHETVAATIVIYAWWGRIIMSIGSALLTMESVLMLITAIQIAIKGEGLVEKGGKAK